MEMPTGPGWIILMKEGGQGEVRGGKNDRSCLKEAAVSQLQLLVVVQVWCCQDFRFSDIRRQDFYVKISAI